MVLMIMASFSEVLSIGAILPFLAVLTAPNVVFEHHLLQPFIEGFGISSPDQLLAPLTVGFGLAVIVSAGMRMLLLWVGVRISFATGHDLSSDIYERTLYQPYSVHVARNSSKVIHGITAKASGVINGIIIPAMTILSSTIMMATILIALLMVNPTIALTAFGGFGLIYLLIIKLTRERLLINGERIAKESTTVIKSVQEGLGGIRDVLIDSSQATYRQIYRNADLPLRRAEARNLFIGQSPRYLMEALGMILLSGLAYGLSKQPDGITKALPILGAITLAAQRVLPILQQAYVAWSCIRGGQPALEEVLELLDQELPYYAYEKAGSPIPFLQDIRLKRVSFRYRDDTAWVLKNLDVTISKGSSIGFIGKTGSGKSTLLDVVMGLLQPTDGTIEIDGTTITELNSRRWQAHIAHVPQAIFLADSTISENIAFGVPKDQINHARVKSSAHHAQIAETIEAWPRQYETLVGERGVQMSGGQCQRIGIARALYRKADVIILDEASSALDSETELAVMQAIEGLSKHLTIFIIAHRLTTLKNCTQIVELEDGVLKGIDTYDNIMRKRA